MRKKKKKTREGESNLLLIITLCSWAQMFYIFLPHCLLCTLSTWHVRKGRFIILFLEKRIILGVIFFYNNLNKYCAFTLMCPFLWSVWEGIILIRSKYS